MTKIEWTKNADGTAGKTWNPIVGCRRVSAGCENCYAERTVHRGMSPQHKGLTVLGKKGPRWNGEFNVVEKRFDEPLRRKKPTTWFVNSLSDLFFEPLPFELIAAIFGIMAATPQHTYQVLTKRSERAREFFAWLGTAPIEPEYGSGPRQWRRMLNDAQSALPSGPNGETPDHLVTLNNAWVGGGPWPLPNVHLGVSVENQATADERIPVLLDLPAALRWVSYEPALGPVDFAPWLPEWCCSGFECGCRGMPINPGQNAAGEWVPHWLRWVVVGGESGPGARPFDLAWARATIEQCAAADVPVFVKQLGALARCGSGDVPKDRRVHRKTTRAAPPGWYLKLKNRKGGDPDEWPKDLHVRQMPTSGTL